MKVNRAKNSEKNCCHINCRRVIERNELQLENVIAENYKITLCKQCAKNMLLKRTKRNSKLFKELTTDTVLAIQISVIPDVISQEDEEHNSDDDYMDYINNEIQMMQ